MIIIDKTLISNDTIEKKFTCEISSCKGGCCVKGEYNNFEKLKKYISKKGIEILNNK